MKKIILTCSIIFFAIALLNFVSVNAQVPIKKVLIEEFTTASCGNCPPMSAHINTWHNSYSGSSIVMAIHEGSGNDAMSNATTDAIFNAMHPTASWFAPAAMINRGVYPSTNGEAYLSCYNSWGSGTGIGIDTIAIRLMNEPAKVAVEISGTYNSVTRTVNATVHTTFADTIYSGDWRINLFLVEDSVVGIPGLGPFAGWDQECYDATWANANYPGMFNGSVILGYPHRHVMRDALLGTWGAQGVIPAVPVVGTTYTATVTWPVDTTYNENHLSLVSFVSSYGSNKNQKYVLNANDVVLTPVFSTGIDNTLNNASSFAIENIYPVPSSGETKIIYSVAKACKTEITITNMLGQRVDVLSSLFTKAGKHEIIFDASKFTKGIYCISLNTSNGSHVKKFMAE